MSRPLTVDSCVFVRAASDREEERTESLRFVRSLSAGGQVVALPTLVRAEVASACRRAGAEPDLVRAIVAEIDRIPGVYFVPLDGGLGQEAVDIAIECGLRGSDSVLAAVARRFDSVLVTLDKELRTRGPADVDARYPEEVG